MSEIKIPDFDDLIGLTERIGTLKLSINMDQIELDRLLANITNTVTVTKEFWVNNKPPSMSYIDSNYHKAGYDDETRDLLYTLRKRLAENQAELDEKELLFKVYQAQIEVWRTESANRRASVWEGG